MSRRWTTLAVLAIMATLMVPATSQAGDAFVKVGITVDPDLGDFSDQLFFSGGTEWGWIEERGFVGFDIQSAYRKMEVGSLTTTTVPLNIFGTVKWKSPDQVIRPYAGGGVGLMSAWVKVEDTGGESNEWVQDVGFELMGGVEFDRKFVTEFMGQRVFDEGGVWFWNVLFGYRF